jgi:hypothetical protein
LIRAGLPHRHGCRAFLESGLRGIAHSADATNAETLWTSKNPLLNVGNHPENANKFYLNLTLFI